MRIDITAKQHKEFTTNQEISFGDLLTEEERLTLCRFRQGHNAWMRDPLVKKILSKKVIAEIIHELSGSNQIRLLFDRALSSGEVDMNAICVQGVLFYILISFETGAITFVDKEKVREITDPSLLAIYGRGDSLYIFNESDPYTHELKKLGYVFGDRLKPTDFPFIYH